MNLGASAGWRLVFQIAKVWVWGYPGRCGLLFLFLIILCAFDGKNGGMGVGVHTNIEMPHFFVPRPNKIGVISCYDDG
jgi:hypothetical protein